MLRLNLSLVVCIGLFSAALIFGGALNLKTRRLNNIIGFAVWKLLKVIINLGLCVLGLSVRGKTSTYVIATQVY